MAKRKKKKKQVAKTAVSTPEIAVESATPMTKQQKTAEKFKVEYAYVVKDLRTIFILAAIMFTLLIALNLFLA